jgi:hypothetical protein
MKRSQHSHPFLDLSDGDNPVVHRVEKITVRTSPARAPILQSWNPLSIPTPVRQQHPWFIDPGEPLLCARIDKLVLRQALVISCHVQGAVYATLPGSTAESILQRTSVPNLAVKAKGSGLSLLAQLRQLSSQ